MHPFTESDRHNYPSLSEAAWVLDLGSHRGKTARILAEKYKCHVVCYEPVKSFYDDLVAMIVATPGLSSYLNAVCAGVGAEARPEKFGIKGELTGIVCGGETTEWVTILPVRDVIARWTKHFKQPADLLSMNIEGMEYEALEAILDDGLECHFKHIQVQPHSVVPRALERWAAIKNRLSMNFRVTHEDPAMDTGWLLLSQK